MKVTIELHAGPDKSEHVISDDIQKNIDAQMRAIRGEGLSHDFVLLIDTLSILEGIKRQWKELRGNCNNTAEANDESNPTC